jgi:hypothetical protein
MDALAKSIPAWRTGGRYYRGRVGGADAGATVGDALLVAGHDAAAVGPDDPRGPCTILSSEATSCTMILPVCTMIRGSRNNRADERLPARSYNALRFAFLVDEETIVE